MHDITGKIILMMMEFALLAILLALLAWNTLHGPLIGVAAATGQQKQMMPTKTQGSAWFMHDITGEIILMMTEFTLLAILLALLAWNTLHGPLIGVAAATGQQKQMMPTKTQGSATVEPY